MAKDIMVTSTSKLTHPLRLFRSFRLFARFARPSLKMRTISLRSAQPWLYQYCLDIDIAEDEFSGDEVGEWVEFDYQANNHINRCVLSGRENTVLYDDNFTILINVVERTWASPVKGENERSNLGFIARRGDVDALLPTLAVKDEVKGEGEQKEDDIFEAKLVMLEAMGFERRRAKAALVECSDVIDRAVAFLCNTTE